MNSRLQLITVLTLGGIVGWLVGVAVPRSQAQTPAVQAAGPTQTRKGDIPVSDLLQVENIIGVLGKPLGTRTVITGVEHPTLLPNPLAVAQVDGHALPNGAIIEVRGNVKLREGVRYRLEGYEAGEFTGSPMWLHPNIQQPFQYRPYFVVTRVLGAAAVGKSAQLHGRLIR